MIDIKGEKGSIMDMGKSGRAADDLYNEDLAPTTDAQRTWD